MLRYRPKISTASLLALGKRLLAVQPPLALFRMDFATRVRTADGGGRQAVVSQELLQ